jgi:NiFe hydrogenase small subunit HydA
MSCIIGGRPFVEQLQEVAKDCKAIISWGSCASWGCVQAARPNPTRATPVHKVIKDKPIIKVPGCPPIAEVMTGVLTYMLTFDRIPELDRQGRPVMFYGQRIHDKCYRRPHFDAGQFVEDWDDEAARKGYCLYKMGCKGPTTYNACSTVRWNNGVSRVVVDPVTRIEGHMRMRGEDGRNNIIQGLLHRHHGARHRDHPARSRPARRLGLAQRICGVCTWCTAWPRCARWRTR